MEVKAVMNTHPNSRLWETYLQSSSSSRFFVDFEKTLLGFDRHLPAVFPLLVGAEHYQSLEIALPNVGEHYLKVEFSIAISVTTLPFDN
jgi:hypothetical protein